MVGPLVYDLAKQHVSELLAEREGDRLAAQLPPAPKKGTPRFHFGWLFPAPPNRHSGLAPS
jgi:hypothetical protein